jgi:hypothetical protein
MDWSIHVGNVRKTVSAVELVRLVWTEGRTLEVPLKMAEMTVRVSLAPLD